MELDALADLVDNMVIQHDYPGFEPRGLKLGLPEDALRSPTRVFVAALGHSNVYVKLAALRWFQERPGIAKPHVKAIAGLLADKDEWVKVEAIRSIERMSGVPDEVAGQIALRLADPAIEVRKAAAKATGKIGGRMKKKNETIIAALQQAAADGDAGVRFKAQKALRLLGAYSSES